MADEWVEKKKKRKENLAGVRRRCQVKGTLRHFFFKTENSLE